MAIRTRRRGTGGGGKKTVSWIYRSVTPLYLIYRFQLMDAWKTIPDFADRIASESLKQYDRLPKTGKPQTQDTRAEWTILATVVQVYTRRLLLLALSINSSSYIFQ